MDVGNDLDLSLSGGDIMMLFVHCGLWIIVLIMIEMGIFRCLSGCLMILKKNRIKERNESEINRDEDVIEEENRID